MARIRTVAAWTSVALALPLASVTPPAAAAAGDNNPLVRDSVPQKWINPLVPEDLSDLEYPGYFNDLDKARAQAFAGRYKLALQTLHKAKDLKPEQAAAVAQVKIRSLAATGRLEEALKVASDPAVATDPSIEVRRGEVLGDLGRNGDAIALLKKHVEAHPHSLAGHYALGAACERVGDTDGARKAFGWFVAEPQKFLDKWRDNPRAEVFESAENLTTIGRALDRWATLTEAYRDDVNLNQTIFDLFVKAYDVKDRGYWPAHVAAAAYYMSHDNRQEAEAELKLALKGNPQDAEAWRLMALLALEQFNFDGADRSIGAIRNANPTSTVAELLEARNLLLQRRPQDAEAPVRRVLAKQPDNLEALGLQAAVYALQLKEEQEKEALAKVEKLDPDNASAYLEVAEQLGAMRQYPRGIARYKVAIERAPWWTDARNGLGLLYTLRVHHGGGGGAQRVDVAVPAGVDVGDRLRLAGVAAQGVGRGFGQRAHAGVV